MDPENELEFVDHDDIEKEGVHEILSAHKDLIDITNSQNEKFVLMMQAHKFILKANY